MADVARILNSNIITDDGDLQRFLIANYRVINDFNLQDAIERLTTGSIILNRVLSSSTLIFDLTTDQRISGFVLSESLLISDSITTDVLLSTLNIGAVITVEKYRRYSS